LLLATDRDGQTALHVVSRYGNLDVMQKLWELVRENRTTGEIKNNLLLATETNGQTSLHVAARYGNLDVMKKLWDLARENLTTEEIKSNFSIIHRQGRPNNFACGNTLWQCRRNAETMGVGKRESNNRGDKK
jgi:ankyrin repeat protein